MAINWSPVWAPIGDRLYGTVFRAVMAVILLPFLWVGGINSADKECFSQSTNSVKLRFASFDEIDEGGSFELWQMVHGMHGLYPIIPEKYRKKVKKEIAI